MKSQQSLINLFGVLAVSLCWSVGGPLAWVATQSLSAAETAWIRCSFAFLGLSPFFVLDGRQVWTQLKPKGKLLLASSGLVLGIHFYLFIAGVAYASLSTAVTLVAAEPVLILLVGVFGFKERIRLESFFGILLCVFGILVISVLPFLMSSQLKAPGKAYGDLCAILAVMSYGVYYGLNRAFRPYERGLALKASSLRQSFSLASIIYFFMALSSSLLAFASHLKTSAPFISPSPRVWMALVAMGLIPTVLGHTLNQIVSRRAHSVWVSLMSPGETLTALMLGYVFLGQTMRTSEAIGGFLILAGALLTAHGESKPQA